DLRGSPAGPLDPGHLLGNLVAAGLELLHLGDQRPAALVEGEHLIDGRLLAAAAHGLPHLVRIVADQLDVQHDTGLPARAGPMRPGLVQRLRLRLSSRAREKACAKAGACARLRDHRNNKGMTRQGALHPAGPPGSVLPRSPGRPAGSTARASPGRPAPAGRPASRRPALPRCRGRRRSDGRSRARTARVPCCRHHLIHRGSKSAAVMAGIGVSTARLNSHKPTARNTVDKTNTSGMPAASAMYPPKSGPRAWPSPMVLL